MLRRFVPVPPLPTHSCSGSPFPLPSKFSGNGLSHQSDGWPRFFFRTACMSSLLSSSAAAASPSASAAVSASTRALAIASTSVLTLATCASTSALLRPVGAAREGASDTGSSSCPCSTPLPSPSSCRGLPVATRWRLTVGEKACAARVAAYAPCHHSDSLSRVAFGSSEVCVGLLAGVAPGVDVRGAGLVLGDLHIPSYELFG
mmetsp:Transcript_60466/g.166108  ORF Transcript_60466/g.166108 Transcript_60466/m.166108 type:complete len:203 (+) Transcript_60466:444-1052(+)